MADEDAATLARLRALLESWQNVGGCEWGCDTELREALEPPAADECPAGHGAQCCRRPDLCRAALAMWNA